MRRAVILIAWGVACLCGAIARCHPALMDLWMNPLINVAVVLTLTAAVVVATREAWDLYVLFKNRATAAQSGGTTKPPRGPQLLVYLCLPFERREDVLGDLDEQFERARGRFGAFWARVIYWVDAARIVGPMLIHGWKKAAQVGLLGWLGWLFHGTGVGHWLMAALQRLLEKLAW